MTMLSSDRRFRLGFLLAAILASAPAPAFAADTPQDRAEAKRLYSEAKKLRSAGKDAEALALFRRAHELMATPVLRLELAQALEKQKKLVEAHALLVSVGTMPVSATETQKGKAAREEAKAAAAALALRIPKATIVVTPASAETKVAIDGQEVSNELLGEVALDPGDHNVSGQQGSLLAEQAFTLAEGERRTIELKLPVPEPPPPPPDPVPPKIEPIKPPAVAPKPPPEKAVAPRGLTPVVPVALSVAGVGLATGIVTGAIALSQVGALQTQCLNTRCLPDQQGLLSAHQALGTASTVGFAVGGAAAAVGVTAWIIDVARRPGNPSTAPPKGASLELRWTGTGVAVNGAW